MTAMSNHPSITTKTHVAHIDHQHPPAERHQQEESNVCKGITLSCNMHPATGLYDK